MSVYDRWDKSPVARGSSDTAWRVRPSVDYRLGPTSGLWGRRSTSANLADLADGGCHLACIGKGRQAGGTD